MNKEKKIMNRIAGLILSAGYSSRMGDFKPLLPFGEDNTLNRQIKTFQRAGIQNICVVVGHNSEKLIPIIESAGVHWVLNKEYDKGMFSSVQTGVGKLKELSCDGFFLLPVDYPLVRWWIIRILLNVYEKNKENILYPCFEGEKGHPPMIPGHYMNEILGFTGTGGLRKVLERYEEQSVRVETGDKSIMYDMDTKDAYKRLLGYFNLYGHSEEEKCFKLLNDQNTSPNIKAHSKKVAEIALIIAIALNQKGYKLNLHNIACAGLLHDIAKGQPSHAKVGGEIVLNAVGNREIAEIIGYHMDLGDRDSKMIDEVAIIYLADKLIKETKIVSLEQRLESTLKKFKGDVSSIPFALEKIKKAEQIKKQIEAVLDRDLNEII